MFIINKCSVGHETVQEPGEDFCYATVAGKGLVRIDGKPPNECSAGNEVYELHERCREAFALDPRP